MNVDQIRRMVESFQEKEMVEKKMIRVKLNKDAYIDITEKK